MSLDYGDEMVPSLTVMGPDDGALAAIDFARNAFAEPFALVNHLGLRLTKAAAGIAVAVVIGFAIRRNSEVPWRLPSLILGEGLLGLGAQGDRTLADRRIDHGATTGNQR